MLKLQKNNRQSLAWISLFILVFFSLPQLYGQTKPTVTSGKVEATKPTNLVQNGDFEKGTEGWGYQQWKGKLLPGYIDRENPYEGFASFRMTDPKGDGLRMLSLPISGVDPSKNYRLSMTLACKDVPTKAVIIRLLQFGMDKPNKKGNSTPQGWVTIIPGVADLITTGGNHGWQEFSFNIPSQSLKPTTKYLTLFIYHSKIEAGVVGIDQISLVSIKHMPISLAVPTQKKMNATQANTLNVDSIAEKIFQVETYQTYNPTVLIVDSHAKAAIELMPNQSLYRVGKLPHIQINYQAVPDGKLAWKMIDGFGNILSKGDQSTNVAGHFTIDWSTNIDTLKKKEAITLVDTSKRDHLDIDTSSNEIASKEKVDRLPATSRAGSVATSESASGVAVTSGVGVGYYELIATITQGDKIPKVVSQVRRSFGVLTPPASINTDEPFGLWVQGNELYAELGVRWTRDSLYYPLWKNQRESYLEKVIQRLESWRKQGIRVLIFPNSLPTKYAHTRILIKDTPKAWQAAEAYWIDIVKALKGHVDAWGLINEPYRGLWEGDDKLIVKYWSIMRKIIDRYDPKTPLIGPCLNTNTPQMMAQYQDLMKLGFAPLIDGIELHPYTGMNMPAQINWIGKIAQTQKITREADKEKPIWATEMGMSCNYDQELYQAQYTARSFLWAKRMNFKMLNWHMLSWPQGALLTQRNFGFFRNKATRNQDKTWGSKIPQPRPAGVAFGVMTRQLAGASFKHELDYLGPSIKAFVFKRADGPMLVIWSTDSQNHPIRLAMQNTVTVTNLFGQTQMAIPSDGTLELAASASPIYLSMVDDSYLQNQPLAKVDKKVQVIAGSQALVQVQLHNPTAKRASVSVQWLKNPSLHIDNPKTTWDIAAKGDLKVSLTVIARANVRSGYEVVYGRLRLNGRYVTPLSIPIEIQPVVEIVKVQPTMVWQQVPALRVTLQKNGGNNQSALLQIENLNMSAIAVHFEGKKSKTITIPLAQLKPDQLQSIQLDTIRNSRVEQSVQEQYSFVPATQIISALQIDGDLSDWPIKETLWQKGKPFSVRWGWDSKNLYLAVRAIDAIHHQTQLVDRMWLGDSIQIGIAAAQAKQWIRKPISEMMEADFMELCLAVNQQKQSKLYRGRTPNRVIAPVGEVGQNKASFAVTHKGKQTTYEMRLPFSQIGLKPMQLGNLIRVSVLLNKNDGHGRTFLEWFSGIGSGKTPSLFGHLILRGPAR